MSDTTAQSYQDLFKSVTKESLTQSAKDVEAAMEEKIRSFDNATFESKKMAINNLIQSWKSLIDNI